MESHNTPKNIEVLITALDHYHELIKKSILEHGEIPENLPDVYIYTLLKADLLLKKPSLKKLLDYSGVTLNP